jgi:hypothetical protein
MPRVRHVNKRDKRSSRDFCNPRRQFSGKSYSGEKGDLGVNNIGELYKRACNPDYATYADVGVRAGISSTVLVNAANDSGGHVYGIDMGKVTLPWNSVTGYSTKNYTFIRSESVTAGKKWKGHGRPNPDFVFIDTCHTDSFILCELYYWWDLLKVGGTMAFHDTHWPDGMFDKTDDRIWGRVDQGLEVFFGADLVQRGNLEAATESILNSVPVTYENEHIFSEHFADSFGMTFIRKKDDFDYKLRQHSTDWDKYFEDRKCLLEHIKGEGNIVWEDLEMEI